MKVLCLMKMAIFTLFSIHAEGYYVFAREGVDVGSLDLEQLRVETINSYGGWFQKMDVCPDSLPVVEGGVTPPVVQGGVLPP